MMTDQEFKMSVVGIAAVVGTVVYLIMDISKPAKPMTHDHNYTVRAGFLALAKETNIIVMECQICNECGVIRLKP